MTATLDALGRRYGHPPSAFLRVVLNPFEALTIDLAAATEGTRREVAAARKLRRDAEIRSRSRR